jgi:hypothetical protein
VEEGGVSDLLVSVVFVFVVIHISIVKFSRYIGICIHILYFNKTFSL